MVHQSTVNLQADWIEEDLARIFEAAEANDPVLLAVVLETRGKAIRSTCERMRSLSVMTGKVSTSS